MKGFDPELFLDIAKKIWNDKNFNLEGRLRTAISRSYYAAFLKSFLKLQSLGDSFQDDQRIHKIVRDKLQKRKKSNIASKLNTLFDNRVKADYKPYAKVDLSLYQQSVKLAENIINQIDEL